MFPETGPVIAFYGDDFTGSTDSMEALAFNGMKTVLFFEPPSKELLAERFPDVKAVGVAGISRSLGPEEMGRELRPIFEELAALGTPVIHYKVCSTFDSGPHIGSIGRAADIGREVFQPVGCIPLLVGVPKLRRYTVFGHHFAGVGGEVHRLDRHPTMSRHPVTPMDESDLRLFLGRQTNQSIGLMDIYDLDGESPLVRSKFEEKLKSGPDILLFDVLDEERLQKSGQLIWEAAERERTFVIGSSGVEYALGAHWKAEGWIGEKELGLDSPGRAEQILVLSGSCSPATKEQIGYAVDAGFSGIKVPAAALIESEKSDGVRAELFERAMTEIRQNRSVVLYTALGPDDESIQETKRLLTSLGHGSNDSGKLLGEQLGLLGKKLLSASGIRRLVVAGGDTSGYVTKQLQLYGLEAIYPIAPGGPLCRGYSKLPEFDGLELILKGGQVGGADFFVRVLDGGDRL